MEPTPERSSRKARHKSIRETWSDWTTWMSWWGCSGCDGMCSHCDYNNHCHCNHYHNNHCNHHHNNHHTPSTDDSENSSHRRRGNCLDRSQTETNWRRANSRSRRGTRTPCDSVRPRTPGPHPQKHGCWGTSRQWTWWPPKEPRARDVEHWEKWS